MTETNPKTESKRILIFLGITFLITYVYCFAIVYPAVNNQSFLESAMSAVLSQLLIAVVMFFPAIGVLLTRLITKEGFHNAWLRPHFKGNIKTYLLAYFGPGILTLLGIAVYFAFFPDNFDSDYGYLKLTLAAAGTNTTAYPMPLSALLLIQVVQALLLGPIMNFFTCFGEEWGWRGYLLPKMSAKLPALPMLLINGIIWGLWHAPLTAIGHNYGVGYPGFPFTGILAMCCFCTVVGIFFSYLSMKTQSCIPAVLAHGGINSIASVGIYLTKDGGNPFIGPAPIGIIGQIPLIATAAALCIFYFSKMNTQPLASHE